MSNGQNGHGEQVQLTASAIFWVMGNGMSISWSEIQCLPTLGISAFNRPAVPCPFSVAAIKNWSIHKSKCCTFLPYPFPCHCVSSSPEEHVTMVTNPSGAQTKSTFLAGLLSRATGNQSLHCNHQKR